MSFWVVQILTIFLVLGGTSDAKQRVVSVFVYSAQEEIELYKKCFNAFEAKTGIHVDFIVAPGGEMEKWRQVIVRTAGGLSPDVVGSVGIEFVPYAAQGLIRPVDDLIKRDRLDLSDTAPMLLTALRWRGRQYVMPYGASGTTLVYNVQLFEERGVEAPPKRWGDPTWTWRKFLDAMQKLTVREVSGKIKQFGLAGPFYETWIEVPYNWGGDWVDTELTRFTGNEPQVLAALQALQDLKWRYHVMPQPGESASLLSGNAAVAGYGTWNLEFLRRSDLPLRFMPWFQVGNAQPAGSVNPMGVAILAAAPHPEEAWEFVKFVTIDPEGNFMYARARGAAPAVRKAQAGWIKDVETGSHNAPGLNAMVFAEQIISYAAVDRITGLSTFNEIYEIMTKVFTAIMNNEKSPEHAMREVTPSIEALIKGAKRY